MDFFFSRKFMYTKGELALCEKDGWWIIMGPRSGSLIILSRVGREAFDEGG